MDSGARILAKRYARAYMDLDGKAHSPALETSAKHKIDALGKVLEACGPHMRALTHPAVNSAIKIEVLAKILGPGNKGAAADFAALLVRQSRFGLLDVIAKECSKISDAFCGVARAEVVSRFPLSEGEVKRITALLAGATGGKVDLRQVIDERVVGGFEIKLGDALIDATVRGRLEALKAGLLK